MTQQNEKQKSIGGLYNKTSKKGLDFLSGFIEVKGEKINLVIFQNQKKYDENTPDYSIFVSQPLQQGTYKPATPQPQREVAKAPVRYDASEQDDEIPF